MQGSQSEARKDALFLARASADKYLDPSLDAPLVLSQQPDFLYEVTALQEIYLNRGHILFKSVICHPEMAGGGIEYAWGKLKYEQRQRNQSAKAKLKSGEEFYAAIEALVHDKTVMSMERAWKYQRRARDYMRVYRAVSLGGCIGTGVASELTYADIEKMRTHQKSHRCTGEQDAQFCRA